MSKANVRLARETNDAVRRGDWDAVATSIDPHVSLRADPSWPEQRIYGREAVLDFYRGLQEVQGTDVRIEEIVDLGDRLLVRLWWRTHGQHSGIEGELRLSEIATIRENSYVLIEYFLDHEQALKAVGIQE